MKYIGIDHHKQYSHMTLLDEKGKELRSGIVWNTYGDVESFLDRDKDEIKAVIEAGRSSYVMVDLLKGFGVDVKIAHASDVKAIARAKINTDKRDSKILAHLLRSDLIPEVYARSEENRRSQRLLRHRAFYVGTMTRVKNKIRVLLAQQRIELQESIRVKNIFSQKGLTALMEAKLPNPGQGLLDGLLMLYRHLEERIKDSNALVKEQYEKLEGAQIISTVPGFGPFFSVLMATEIADVRRFKSVDKLHCYAGVIPSTHSSGGRTYHGKMIKAGNPWLRWAAIEAVYPACRKDFDISLFYNKHVKRKGANMAKVATARRLLTIIYRVLKDGRPYIPYKR